MTEGMKVNKIIITVLMTILTFTASLPLQAQETSTAVTQANIHQTICVRGYTATVRPTYTQSSDIKHKICRIQGIIYCRDVILDHIIPLEVGGHPASLANLQLQDSEGSKLKDKLENKLHKDVCSGIITLKAAQKQFKREK